MKKTQRKKLGELLSVCNSLGGRLDGTATPDHKYRDRQQAHMDVYHVIYGILGDYPENDYREEDIERADAAMERLKGLVNKTYTDRNGHLKEEER